jgi:hypothetical protein
LLPLPLVERVGLNPHDRRTEDVDLIRAAPERWRGHRRAARGVGPVQMTDQPLLTEHEF